jgi:hypothetical protein
MINKDNESNLSRLDQAIIFAVKAHSGQVDKLGLPVILHPIAVMLMGKGESERVVGILHDIMEDTPYSLNDLIENVEGLTGEESAALVSLTHMKGEPYEHYIRRVQEDDLAARVKLNDLAHNTSPERMNLLPEDVQMRLIFKYTMAKGILTENLSNGSPKEIDFRCKDCHHWEVEKFYNEFQSTGRCPYFLKNKIWGTDQPCGHFDYKELACYKQKR